MPEYSTTKKEQPKGDTVSYEDIKKKKGKKDSSWTSLFMKVDFPSMKEQKKRAEKERRQKALEKKVKK